MNEKLTADQIFIEETIKAFEEQNNTVASEEDKKRIDLLMRKQTHFNVAIATAERFAAQQTKGMFTKEQFERALNSPTSSSIESLQETFRDIFPETNFTKINKEIKVL